MTTRISPAALLLFASFAPVSVSADSIELSDVRISARASFSSQQVPERATLMSRSPRPTSYFKRRRPW